MTKEHFQALLSMAEATPDAGGWAATAQERWLTLHASHEGVGLTVAKVVALRQDGELVFARTSKGDHFILALADLYAASVEAPKEQTRQAGFR
jgi:hypothetical protein